MEPQQLDGLLWAGRRRKTLSLVVLLAALALAGAASAWYLQARKHKRGIGPSYRTAVVIRGELKSAITATGTVEALNTVEVGAEISGRIEAIHVDFNDRVKRGQLLAEIDPEQYEAARAEAAARLQAARAAVTEARAAADEAGHAADRARALAKRGLISSQELESATASETRTAAALQSARANQALSAALLAAARSRLLKTKITSPIDGTVLSRQIEVGQSVNSSTQTPVLFAIAEDLSRMQLSASVDEADIGMVAVDQKATFTVDAYADRKFASGVTSIRNVATVDQNVVTYETLLSVDNKDLLLRPGMTATVEIISMLYTDVLLVPAAALRFTPPGALESGRRRGPPIPIIGRSKKPPQVSQDRKALIDLGEIGAGQGVLWLLERGSPVPVKVKQIATDGTSTAVQGEQLAEGAQVIVDLASDRETG